MTILKNFQNIVTGKTASAKQTDLDLYDEKMDQYGVLSWCIIQLCFDDEMKIDAIVDALNPNDDKESFPMIVKRAKEKMDAVIDYEDDLDDPEVVAMINIYWLSFYGEALSELISTNDDTINTKKAEKSLNDGNPEAAVTQGLIDDLNNSMRFVNYVLHQKFISHLGFNETTMPISRIQTYLAHAAEKGMTDGDTPLRDWFWEVHQDLFDKVDQSGKLKCTI